MASSIRCFSTTADSVVSTIAAIDAALATAALVTLTGSMMPASTRSPYSPVAALKPCPTPARATLLTTTAPSWPAFAAIQRERRVERLADDRDAGAPRRRSGPRPSISAAAACTSAEPPPGMMPSSTAALVADDRVLDAVLALLELDLGGRADLDHARRRRPAWPAAPAASRGPSRSRWPRSRAGSARPGRRSRLGRAAAVDDRGVVLGDGDPAGGAEHLEADLGRA